ncbi:MAG: hypothetical protein ACYSUT_04850, partial [Planctomycetota bacterium]
MDDLKGLAEVATSASRNIKGNKRTSIPLCELTKSRKPIKASYDFHQGIVQSHKVLFKKGNRAVFELFLPEQKKSLASLCDASESLLAYTGLLMDMEAEKKAKKELGLSCYFFVKILGKKIKDISTPFVDIERTSQIFNSNVCSNKKYLLISMSGWKNNVIIILQKRDGSSKSRYRKSKS